MPFRVPRQLHQSWPLRRSQSDMSSKTCQCEICRRASISVERRHGKSRVRRKWFSRRKMQCHSRMRRGHRRAFHVHRSAPYVVSSSLLVAALRHIRVADQDTTRLHPLRTALRLPIDDFADADDVSHLQSGRHRSRKSRRDQILSAALRRPQHCGSRATMLCSDSADGHHGPIQLEQRNAVHRRGLQFCPAAAPTPRAIAATMATGL